MKTSPGGNPAAHHGESMSIVDSNNPIVSTQIARGGEWVVLKAEVINLRWIDHEMVAYTLRYPDGSTKEWCCWYDEYQKMVA